MNIKHSALMQKFGLERKTAGKKTGEHFQLFDAAMAERDRLKSELEQDPDNEDLQTELQETEDDIETIDNELCEMVNVWNERAEIARQRFKRDGQTTRKPAPAAKQPAPVATQPAPAATPSTVTHTHVANTPQFETTPATVLAETVEVQEKEDDWGWWLLGGIALIVTGGFFLRKR